MNEKLERLKELAEKATNLPIALVRYEHGGGRMYVEVSGQRHLVCDTFNECDREFIYACDRQTILSLIAELEAKEAEVERFKTALAYVLDDYRKVDMHNTAHTWPTEIQHTCKDAWPQFCLEEPEA